MAAFLGMRGTGDWGADERPTNFREGILYLNPNGSAPLTAITAKGRSRKVDDTTYSYWSKNLALQGGAVTGVYKDQALSSAWGGGDAGVVGSLVYVKTSAAIASEFRPAHTVLMVDKDNMAKTSFGKVLSVSQNGSSSYICVQLKAASTTGYLAAVDYIDIIGSANSEGSGIGDSISYNPTKYTNYTQILSTPLDITGTQLATRMRTKDAYLEAKREAALYHALGIENTGIFNPVAYEGVGDNGKPERYTMGMLGFINTYSSDNVLDFKNDAGTTSYKWIQAGEDWLDESFEVLFRYGSEERLCLCGSGALLGIAKLMKAAGTFNFTSKTGSYGVRVLEWVTPHGTVYFKTHPLFTQKPHMRNAMVLFEPQNIQYVYLQGRDTTYREDPGAKKAGYNRIDGIKEEYITEAGWEFHFPETFMYLQGVGLDGASV